MPEIYRADHVGSLLRPEEVKEARAAFAAGQISREQLSEAEDRSIFNALEWLALSPQCGFASTFSGNLMTEDQQWRNLELVAETARKVWG